MQDVSDGVVEALEALARGDTTILPAGEDRASRALRTIIEQRRADMLTRLDGVVSLTANVNQQAVSGAWVLISSQKIGSAALDVAAASEELSASVASIDAEVKVSRSMADQMRDAAASSTAELGRVTEATERTASSMQDAADSTQSLISATSKITEIVQAIESIAMQTNLLALNASIEAARAGEAGRGFTVVASEVRDLSVKTKDATARIGTMVEALNTEVSQIGDTVSTAEADARAGAAILQQLTGVIATLDDSTRAVDTSLTSISSSVSEQNEAAGMLASSAAQVSSFAERNLESLEAFNTASDNLVGMAQKQMADMAEADVPHKVLRLAKADHVIWKKRLMDMFSGRKGLNADELANHRHCRLGKWYYSDASRPYRSMGTFAALENPHARVHEAGIRAAKDCAAGNKSGAYTYIQEVEAASKEVLHLLDRLIAECSGSVDLAA